MNVAFTPQGWAEYTGWLVGDPKLLLKLNDLIESARRTPFKGLGKPEPLKGDLKGWWSRRLTQEHRLVYRVAGSGDDQHIEVARCRGHY